MATRVLVADDEADILRLLQVKLSKAGFDVSTARNGKEALERALSDQPDLMVLDVMMPEMNGFEVVAEVKRVRGNHAPIMILLTAKGQEADVVEGLTSGADDYIIKPFSPRELIARVNVALIKHRKPTASEAPS